MTKLKRFVRAAAAVSAGAVLSACAGHKTVKVDSSQQQKAQDASAAQIAAADPIEASEPTMRDSAVREIPELKIVHFSYDSDILTEDARATLRANATWLREHDTIKVQVAGNCDQRGTTEYNLALGQRRATAVRKYYMHLGVPGSRVATISYGKEHLICAEMTDECWAKNRRGETLEALTQNVGTRTAPAPAAH